MTTQSGGPELGLRVNWEQFTLLVIVNAFVGAMVGIERAVLPLVAAHDFGLASRSAVLAFVASFGAVKAAANFAAGRLGDRWGRKHVLVAGWILALPVPPLIMWAPSWWWIVAANVLLGANQGLAWSTTVIMKIDLVGPHRRGLAMGLNEFAGYVAVALAAYFTAALATRFGLRAPPLYIGSAVALAGLVLSATLVRDTTPHARHEASAAPDDTIPGARELLRRTLWRDPALSTTAHVGLVNNLNDGLAWGLFPLFFTAAGLSLRDVGLLAFTYPAVWGVTQLATGALSDRWGRRWLIAGGMIAQGTALASIPFFRGLAPWLAASALLGIGTAMVYPTLLAAVGDVAHPSWRGSAVGIYRLWRDSGYVVGAIGAGVLADTLGMTAAISVIAAVTAGTGIMAAIRMPETLPQTGRHRHMPS